jgi:hypothetical protein
VFLVLVKQRFADFIDRWLTLQVVVVVVVADFLTGLPTLFFTVAELPVAGRSRATTSTQSVRRRNREIGLCSSTYIDIIHLFTNKKSIMQVGRFSIKVSISIWSI